MNPKRWGKSFWMMIIYIVQHRFIKYNKLVYKFLYEIANVLPCIQMCRPNYRRHLRKIPKNATSPDKLLTWLYNIYSWTLEFQHRSPVTYEHFCNRTNMDISDIRKYIKKAIYYICKDEETSMSSIVQFYQVLEKLKIVNLRNNQFIDKRAKVKKDLNSF